MNGISIYGMGKALPNNLVTNTALETSMETTDDWIRTRTGIEQRYMTVTESNTQLSTTASLQALKESNIDVSSITHIIGATCSPDNYSPSLAADVSASLGIHHVSAFDMNAMCSGFLYGLEISRGLLCAKKNTTILLLASELMSRRINMQDRTTAVLFGDASTATILSNASIHTPLARLEDVFTSSDGRLGPCLTVGGGCNTTRSVGDTITDDFFLQMNGREVFKHAVRTMLTACEQILEQNNYTIDDIDLLIPHQANSRIIEAIGDRLNIDKNKIFTNVHKYGNTSAASIPLAICEAKEQGILKKEMRVLIVTFGGGFTWGAGILQF